eukprot:1189975-Prorocentrum_minimum.AAC.3
MEEHREELKTLRGEAEVKEISAAPPCKRSSSNHPEFLTPLTNPSVPTVPPHSHDSWVRPTSHSNALKLTRRSRPRAHRVEGPAYDGSHPEACAN